MFSDALADLGEVELVLYPIDGELEEHLSELPAWRSYAEELSRHIFMIANKAGVESFEIMNLSANGPLSRRLPWMYNGSVIPSFAGVEMAVDMASGNGPYCELIAKGKMVLFAGWDGALSLVVGPDVLEEVECFDRFLVGFRFLSLDLETFEPEGLVEKSADRTFWSDVASVVDGVTLVVEHWAHGLHGKRWFRVTADNLDMIAADMSVGSMVEVFVNPVEEKAVELGERNYFAFRSPFTPGELDCVPVYDEEGLSAAFRNGFTELVRDDLLPVMSAVVPGECGVVRARWEENRGMV
ncbi:hypothetical protein KCV87_00720 [Actinosynnema pretiosum subsp. pretiosum]|uniref:Uncharacterized protein n=1 Tax=Actinosynnema pretiosum subsp. pretiosum TaxID=103721 RepID=A0AA45L7F7_9PSEU|nr:hypothetical protein KCV87_00720 [Actinosynnema pretiosum subsp. pretiosum]